MRICCGILIGGMSRRMGRPKALIEVGGRTVLEMVADAAAKVADEVVLLGEPSFELPSGLRRLEVLEDRRPGKGPMGGLETLLTARAACAGMLLACDMPYLSADLLAKLVQELEDADAAICAVENEGGLQKHPCCGVYQPRIRSLVVECIERGQLSLLRMLERVNTRLVRLTGGEVRWVENWNEPADL